MNRRSLGSSLSGVWLLATMAATCLAAPPATGLVLSFPRGPQPTWLELRIKIGDQAASAVWDETFACLMTFYDRNGNRTLDATEAGRLPAPFILRQILWGRFSTCAGEAPPWATLDASRDGVVTVDELAAYYRGAGLSDVLVGAGWPSGRQRLNSALLNHVDVNRDGRTDRGEWESAARTLRMLDLNDDELIGVGELVSQMSYPGALGSHLIQPLVLRAKLAEPLASLPLEVVTVIGRDQGLTPPADAPVDSPPTAVWLVRLSDDSSRRSKLAIAGGEPPADGRLMLDGGNWRFNLRIGDGQLSEQTAAARKQFVAQFVEADVDANGTLSDEEVRATKARLFRPLAASADRNGDGELSGAELTGWIDLQAQIAKGLTLLTVLDCGVSLFELLDADRDGALSQHELKRALERITAARCLTDSGFDPSNLPRQLLATISHGHPRSPHGQPFRTGPDWFMAMDRNSDGEVSQREWINDLGQFRLLDVDGDGQLSAAEAERLVTPR